jgi:hypothetical protein
MYTLTSTGLTGGAWPVSTYHAASPARHRYVSPNLSASPRSFFRVPSAPSGPALAVEERAGLFVGEEPVSKIPPSEPPHVRMTVRQIRRHLRVRFGPQQGICGGLHRDLLGGRRGPRRPYRDRGEHRTRRFQRLPLPRFRHVHKFPPRLGVATRDSVVVEPKLCYMTPHLIGCVFRPISRRAVACTPLALAGSRRHSKLASRL